MKQPVDVQKILGAILSAAKKIINMLYNRTLPVLTYRKLVEDTILFKPDDPKVKCASAVRETTPEGYTKVSIVYMDADNNVVWDDGKGKEYSFAIVAKSIDSELRGMFGDKNMILFN